MTNLPPSRFFPPAESADAEGVVGFGGELSPEWILDAYQHGIFPWPTGDPSLPVPWCSPDPRAIITWDQFHVPRRLAQTCRGGKFRATFDTDFPAVIRSCATAGTRRGRTWLTTPMIRAYTRLHEMGHGHSAEVWQGDELGRRLLRAGDRRAVRGRVDVLPGPRCLEGRAGTFGGAASRPRFCIHGHPAIDAAHGPIRGRRGAARGLPALLAEALRVAASFGDGPAGSLQA